MSTTVLQTFFSRTAAGLLGSLMLIGSGFSAEVADVAAGGNEASAALESPGAGGSIEPSLDALAILKVVAGLQAQLPVPLVRRWEHVPAPFTGKVLAPGLELVREGEMALHLAGFTLPPPEPELELLVTLAGGNNHESLFRLELEDAALAAASCQFLAPLEPGRPTLEASAIPAIGTPMRIEVLVQPDPLLEPGVWQRIDASCLLIDVATQRPFPSLPFVYTGSETVTIERMRNGEKETIRYFSLAAGRRGWAHVFDDPSGLMASPLPLAGDDTATDVAPAVRLPPGLPVTLRLTIADLPLTLAADAEGTLVTDASDLVPAIQDAFAQAGKDTLRAIAVAVPPAITNTGLVTARESVMRAAVDAQVWAVPVFVWQEHSAASE